RGARPGRRPAHDPPRGAGERAATRRGGPHPRPGRGAGSGPLGGGRPVPRPADPGGGAVRGGPAAAIAAAVRAGDRTARAVVEEHLAAIERSEGSVHAFNLVLAEQALTAADGIDARVAAGDDPGPLAGVPVAVKDN